MRLRNWLAVLLCCLALPLLAQNAQPAPGNNQGGSAQSSEPDNPTPQPVTGSSNPGGGQQENSSQTGQDKKPSGIKKVLRRAAPNCAHVGGGGDHCWSESGREKEAEEKQAEGASQQQPPVPSSQPAPRSSDEPCQDCSSSRSGRVDLSPPPGDAAAHAGSDLPSDVQELHPWNPHRADKDVEVGDFYFKQKNYKAAIARYRDALSWMSNHAAATYKLGLALEKSGDKSEARQQYQQYLKLLPDGPYAAEARKALERLPATTGRATPPPAQKPR